MLLENGKWSALSMNDGRETKGRQGKERGPKGVVDILAVQTIVTGVYSQQKAEIAALCEGLHLRLLVC